jgi:galactose PTS system EIIB component
VIVCHRGLEATARRLAPEKVIVPFDMFLGDPAFDRVVEGIKNGIAIEG